LQNKENDQNNKQTEMDFLKAVNIIGRDLDEAMALLEQLSGLSGPEKAEIKLAWSRIQSASDLLKLLPDMSPAKSPAGLTDTAYRPPEKEQWAVTVTPDPVAVKEPATITESVTFKEPVTMPEQIIMPEPATITEHVTVQEPVTVQRPATMPESAPPPEPAKQPSASRTGQEPAKSILADRFSQTGTLGDKISPVRQDEAISTAMHSRPIADIGAAIGINDRFYFIRELFSGDAIAYSDTIRRLNNSASLGEAMRILDESTVMGSDPAAQSSFVDVVRRKFSLNV
jgi:hypothetical protein